MPTAAFTPTEAQLKEIMVRGPYTRPLEDVYPILTPLAVRRLFCPHASSSHTTFALTLTPTRACPARHAL